MTEIAEKQHGERLAALSAKFIKRGINTRAEAIVDASFQLWQEGEEITRVVCAANLDTVELGQQTKLITQRAQIFPARQHLFGRIAHEGQPARDRLEIDVVLEQDTGDPAELAGILPHNSIFKLQYIDLASVDLAVDQPGQITAAELAHSVRLGRRAAPGQSAAANHVLGGGAHPVELLMRRAVFRIVE